MPAPLVVAYYNFFADPVGCVCVNHSFYIHNIYFVSFSAIQAVNEIGIMVCQKQPLSVNSSKSFAKRLWLSISKPSFVYDSKDVGFSGAYGLSIKIKSPF